MNGENKDIINRFLLIGDKFMPEMDLWDPKAKKYFACGPFTRHQQRINDFRKDGKISHIAKNRLDAACFQHDSACAKYKDRLNREKSDVVLKSKALKIALDPKVNGYQRGLASMVYKIFIERTKGSGIKYDKKLDENKQLAEGLHKPIIRKFFKKEKYILVLKIIFGVLIWLICL